MNLDLEPEFEPGHSKLSDRKLTQRYLDTVKTRLETRIGSGWAAAECSLKHFNLVHAEETPYSYNWAVWEHNSGWFHIGCQQRNVETTFGFEAGDIVWFGQMWPREVTSTVYDMSPS